MSRMIPNVEEPGKDTASDEEQLAFATAENRAILTFNIRDFAPLHEAWQAASSCRHHRVPATGQPPVRTLAPADAAAAQPLHGGANARQSRPPGAIQIAILIATAEGAW